MTCRNTPEKFWSKVKGKERDCWLWPGLVIKGLGRLKYHGKMIQAHSLAYELSFGKPFHNTHVLHTCNQRTCCNPAHLYLSNTLAKNWTGKTYNYFTFIKPIDYNKRGSVIWEVLCKCGNTRHYIPATITSGHAKSCGCKPRECPPRKYTPLIRTARSVWDNYKDGCDFDTFYKLSQLPCHYCGRLPHRTYNIANNKNKRWTKQRIEEGKFTYNGLDRIDSSRGHELDNIVPCCTSCNRAKLDMTTKEFLELIKLIYHHRCIDTSNSENQAS